MGIKRWAVDISGDWRSAVQVISEQEGYTTIAEPESQDPQLTPEHTHDDAEVRLVLEGTGYFITRVGETEEFINVTFAAGDLISMPGNVWHKLGSETGFKGVRFYHNKEKWNRRLRE